MTNAMIIEMEKIRLLTEGVLHYTGRTVEVYNVALARVEEGAEIQPIHTYQGWRARGYQVRKGQKAVAQFPIWKYTKGKTKDMDEEEAQQRGYCFMKNASWFTDEQVDPIVE